MSAQQAGAALDGLDDAERRELSALLVRFVYWLTLCVGKP